MAGDRVTMSPVSLMMIHNPWTLAMGDSEYMRQAMQLLDEVKESIINAYEIKTALPRAKISALMDAETWLSSGRALELGFADDVSKPAKKKSAATPDEEDEPDKDNALTGKAGANRAPRFAYAMHGVESAAVLKAYEKVLNKAYECGGQAVVANGVTGSAQTPPSHVHTVTPSATGFSYTVGSQGESGKQVYTVTYQTQMDPALLAVPGRYVLSNTVTGQNPAYPTYTTTATASMQRENNLGDLLQKTVVPGSGGNTADWTLHISAPTDGSASKLVIHDQYYG
ncbi:MAG: Clp protease ClpP, partial [Chloroflexia bacterium]|nr:Clp protease ClpP [Chloroflexia bacterium]